MNAMSIRLIVGVALLAVATVLLWLAYDYASTYRLYGSTAIARAFQVATAIAGGALFILVAVRLLFRPAYRWLSQQPPTHLQTGVAVTAATFVAVASALAWFGVDLSTILTTSALVTAIVGLSIQPLLASLMSGLALQRTVRVGDGIVVSGKPVAVTSLDWRSVVARRADGTSLIIPNSKLAGDTLEVLPRDRPVRGSIVVELPADVAPHRVRGHLARVAAGIADIDPGRPLSVTPQSCRFDSASVTHVASFWVARFADVPAMEATMLRRTWYALRREGIGSDAGAADDRRPAVAVPALRAALSSSDVDLKALGADFTERAVAEGLHLHYDDGEQIVLPERASGELCVLAAGRVEVIDGIGVERDAGGDRLRHHGDDAHPSGTGGTAATPWLVERALAQRIGPYASVAVRDAVLRGASVIALCHAVAEEIDDRDQRAAFLAEVLPPPRQLRMPGTVFRCTRSAVGLLRVDPPARAVDHAHVIVVGTAAPG